MSFETSALKGLAISENGLVFDPMTGSIFTSNPVGMRIIELLRKGNEVTKVEDAIIDEFDIDRETAVHDAYEFTTQLLGLGLIKDKGKKK